MSFRYLRVFWERAYRENITGLAAMVAYNLALALFPFVLLVLFIFGQIDNADVRQTVIHDLQQIFPSAEQDSPPGSCSTAHPREPATIEAVAAIAAIWIGASRGAMDTAFCRIHHVECRGGRAKRRALLMLFVVILFLPASILVPVAEGYSPRGPTTSRSGSTTWALCDPRRADRGAPAHVRHLRAPLLRSAQGSRPLARRLARGAVRDPDHGDRNAVFPVYLTQSNIEKLGGALGFILIALIWFYSSLTDGGAVINALRELHDTGSVEEERARAFAEME